MVNSEPECRRSPSSFSIQNLFGYEVRTVAKGQNRVHGSPPMTSKSVPGGNRKGSPWLTSSPEVIKVISGTISSVRPTPFWTFLELILAHFWDRGDVPRTDLFQACFWEAKLCEIWWILVQNLGQVRMILCNRSRSAQHRFLNNSPTVFTDLRFREATAATISEPNIDVKSNVQTQVDFGYVFVSNWDSKMMPDRI